MTVKQRPFLQRISIDVLGFLLILIAIPIGWLPGPGGIPLIIIGLSLLATNHEWAEKLLEQVRAHGISLSNKIFNNDPRMKWLLDVVSIGFITAAVLLITMATGSLTKTAGISLIVSGAVLFVGNRKRLESLKKRVKR